MKTFYQRIVELIEGCFISSDGENAMISVTTSPKEDAYVEMDIGNGEICFLRIIKGERHELLRIEKDGTIMKILDELFEEAEMNRIVEEREEMIYEQKRRRLCELQEQMREIMHEIGQMAEIGISRDKTDI